MTNDGWVTRPLEPDGDVPRVVRLFNVVAEADGDPDRATEERFRTALSWPKHHRRVVQAPDDPDCLIGYGLLFDQTVERSIVHVAVHPDWRRRGMGSALLAHLLEQAREIGSACVSIDVDERHTVGNAFLRRNGFQPIASTWMMHAPPDIALEEPRWPAGYTVRTYAEVQNVATLVRAQNLSRRDMWGHWENTEGAVTEERVAHWLTHWDHEGIFIAFAPDDDAAGICRAEAGARSGGPDDASPDVLDAPTVVPEHRPHKLQRPLALTAMGWLRSKGPRAIRLESWGDDEATIDLYREVGFVLDQHYIAYRRDLT